LYLEKLRSGEADVDFLIRSPAGRPVLVELTLFRLRWLLHLKELCSSVDRGDDTHRYAETLAARGPKRNWRKYQPWNKRVSAEISGCLWRPRP